MSSLSKSTHTFEIRHTFDFAWRFRSIRVKTYFRTFFLKDWLYEFVKTSYLFSHHLLVVCVSYRRKQKKSAATVLSTSHSRTPTLRLWGDLEGKGTGLSFHSRRTRAFWIHTHTLQTVWLCNSAVAPTYHPSRPVALRARARFWHRAFLWRARRRWSACRDST